MSTIAKKAILKALIEGVITELMIKTTGEMVYLDDNTVLSAKISEMVTAINARAKTDDVNTALANLKQEILGTLPSDAYDTFQEIAEYIEEHGEVFTALQEAVGNKADKSVVEELSATIATLGALAYKAKVAESDLEDALATKVNDAYNAKHSHPNKTVIDGISEDDVENWNAAYVAKHAHPNKTVIDGIAADDVSNWNAKSKVRVATSQPSDLAAHDLWFQIVE